MRTSLAAALAVLASTTVALPAFAGLAANTNCPPSSVLSANLIVNNGFESGVNSVVTCPAPCSTTPASAATNWKIHADNARHAVTTERRTTSAPGPNGTYMMHVIAGAAESGVFQVPTAPSTGKMMVSAWVYVNRGFVAVAGNALNSAPAAFSTKIGEWEQLRICTDGTVPNDDVYIFNENASGGDFYVDRVEAHPIN